MKLVGSPLPGRGLDSNWELSSVSSSGPSGHFLLLISGVVTTATAPTCDFSVCPRHFQILLFHAELRAADWLFSVSPKLMPTGVVSGTKGFESYLVLCFWLQWRITPPWEESMLFRIMDSVVICFQASVFIIVKYYILCRFLNHVGICHWQSIIWNRFALSHNIVKGVTKPVDFYRKKHTIL